MAKSRRAQSQRRTSQLGIRDDLYPEDIGESGSTVAAKGAEDKILAFLVEDQYSTEHGACLCDVADLPGVMEVRRIGNIKILARSIGALEFVLADLRLPSLSTFNTSTFSLLHSH